jgi:metallo-beta-lactamase family protein
LAIKLTFHGAAGCVTGSCARLETGSATILIDCGMFQGPKTLKELNYRPFPFSAQDVDAVLLTHAHIDHSGLLPKLMRAGYDGPIFATAATRDLCAVMLPDAGGIQEAEVDHLNRRNQHRGRPLVDPIYTKRDGVRVVRQFERVKLDERFEVAPGVHATYYEAGHILGAASIAIEVQTDDGPMSLLFSGDLGPGGRDYAGDPQGPSGVDHLIIESTYGDRERPSVDPEGRRHLLAAELVAAHEAGGPLLLPAFAVERTQELLADLLTLMDSGEAPSGDIFLDSPLAIEATEVFLKRGWNPALGRNPFEGIYPGGRLRFLRKPSESDSLERLRGWHVILAASGMCDAGRVRKHLKRLLWRSEATVLLSGFQAAGTLGRLLADGQTMVRIQGEEFRVRARIRNLDVYSGHADATALVKWATERLPIRGEIFITHGEPSASAELKPRLVSAGLDAQRIRIPDIDSSYVLKLRSADEQPAPHRVPTGAAARLDWHNERAALLEALNLALEAAPDDAARESILARLGGELTRASA